MPTAPISPSAAAPGARALRPATADDKALKLDEADLDDRQKALNDSRMLEGLREDATDTMRRYFLTNCPAGKELIR